MYQSLSPTGTFITRTAHAYAHLTERRPAPTRLLGRFNGAFAAAFTFAIVAGRFASYVILNGGFRLTAPDVHAEENAGAVLAMNTTFAVASAAATFALVLLKDVDVDAVSAATCSEDVDVETRDTHVAEENREPMIQCSVATNEEHCEEGDGAHVAKPLTAPSTSALMLATLRLAATPKMALLIVNDVTFGLVSVSVASNPLLVS